MENREIVGLAIDSPSTDIGTSQDYQAHYMILGADKYNLENLDLTEVPEGKDSVFISLPINIKNAPETSVRVMAIVGVGQNPSAAFISTSPDYTMIKPTELKLLLASLGPVALLLLGLCFAATVMSCRNDKK